MTRDSFRRAITQADEGGDEVDFDLPGGGVHTLTPTKPLPFVDSGVTINGYSQPGSSPNSLAVGDNAVLSIAIAAFGVKNAPDLAVDGGGVTIKELLLNNSPSSPGLALLSGAFATIQGNDFGVTQSGTGAAPDSFAGIYLQDASSNTIGGTKPDARNPISGNGCGIGLEGGGTTGNVIEGDYIGVDNAGSTALANTGTGIIAYDSASGNTIGGTDEGAGNIISGK